MKRSQYTADCIQSHFHDLCATVSTISRSLVSIGRRQHATAANRAANPYTAVANMRDDCMRTYNTNTLIMLKHQRFQQILLLIVYDPLKTIIVL
jgi:hypothetical protein